MFGQPGIYPDGPPMHPASGPPHTDDEFRECLNALNATIGEVAFRAYAESRLAVRDFTYGIPASPGRIVGPVDSTAHGRTDEARRVVNRRYQSEDPRLVLPSVVHALLWSGPGAGHAEEALLHALGAYVHAQLLARAPELASTGTELARRQNSITVTLLNSRQPGSPTITLVARDGPGTIPGGAPAMQTPDFWSVPFGPRDRDGAPIDIVARETLAAAGGVDLADVPDSYTDSLGAWCSEVFTDLLTPSVQLAAMRALGLLE